MASSYISLILIGLVFVMIMDTTTSGLDYNSELKRCRDGTSKDDTDCKLGPYCFTFSSTKEDIDADDNTCNIKLGDTSEKEKCQLPIVSIRKLDRDWFTIVLMGKMEKSGWFAIGFSESDQIMKDKNFAVACFSNKDPEVLNLATNTEGGSPQKPTRASNQNSIKNAKYSLKTGFLVCEFALNNKPKNDGPELDLIGKKYYIGLARGESNGKELSKHDETGYARGSSSSTMEIFKELEPEKPKEKKKVPGSLGSPRVEYSTVGIIGSILCAIVVTCLV